MAVKCRIYIVLYLYVFFVHDSYAQEFILGIDVSHYQGDIVWEVTKQSEVIFAYIKVSEGAHMVDPKFFYNWVETKRLGILSGGYHFFKPGIDPEYQANLFLTNLGFYKNDDMLPPVVDIEVIYNEENHTKLLKDLTIWLKKVESNLNCKPIIYTNYHFWKKYLADILSDYKLWIADYNDNFDWYSVKEKLVFWQFVQDAKVPGIPVLVDKNRFNGNYNELLNLVCKKK